MEHDLLNLTLPSSRFLIQFSTHFYLTFNDVAELRVTLRQQPDSTRRARILLAKVFHISARELRRGVGLSVKKLN